MKPTVLEWYKSPPINTSTIAPRRPHFPLGSMAAHGTEVSGANMANASFTYLGSDANSRMTCQLISWQLPCGFENMKPSSGNAYMEGFYQLSKHLETSPLNSPLV
jgi:hypothetical protein